MTLVSIGDTVRTKVVEIARSRQRISLGLKQTQEDPWQRVISTHRPGDVLEGTVTKVVAFGSFVEILPGVEGLVHISELADHHVESPTEVVEPNSTLHVKILEIDEERRRLSLSIKQVEGQNMPMQDLGAQIQEASGDEPTSTPPTAETPEEDAPESETTEEAPPEPGPEEAEEQEGESVEERPDSPDDTDEAGGEAEPESDQNGDAEQD